MEIEIALDDLIAKLEDILVDINALRKKLNEAISDCEEFAKELRGGNNEGD